MALRNLAAKMRIPASAAPRLLSAPRLLPASGSRALLHNSSPEPLDEIAREWYLLQRGRYDDLNRQLRILNRVVMWTEELDNFLRRFYLIVTPLAAGSLVWEWIDYQEADASKKAAAAME